MRESVVCSGCGHEFSYEYAGGRPRSYCDACVAAPRDARRAMAAKTRAAGPKPPRERSKQRPKVVRIAKASPTANCLTCGRQFEYMRRGERVVRYCSRICSNRRAMDLIPVFVPIPGNEGASVCKQCGVEFRHPPSARRKYCSRRCRVKSQTQRISIECANCGTTFERSPAHASKGRATLCSRKCTAAWRNSGVVQSPCKACGSMFASRGARHTWCTPCRETEQSRDARIVVARHGMTASDFREADEYREIIAGDPCVYCGSPAEQVDHIEPIAAGGSDRWDNYAPVCGPCNLSKYTTPLLTFIGRGGLSGNQGTLGARFYARR